MRRRKSIAAGVAAGCLAVIVAGCGTPDGGEADGATPAASPEIDGTTAEPTETATVTSSPTDEGPHGTSATSPEAEGTGQGTIEEQSEEDALANFAEAPQESDNWEGHTLGVDHDTIQVIVDARHGVHDGFERVVLEFGEDTDLAYRAEYVEPVDGVNALLAVQLKGTTGGPEAEDAALTEPWRADVDGTAVEFIDPREPGAGDSEAHIGLDEQRAFRIHAAEDPMRIIIDIAR